MAEGIVVPVLHYSVRNFTGVTSATGPETVILANNIPIPPYVRIGLSLRQHRLNCATATSISFALRSSPRARTVRRPVRQPAARPRQAVVPRSPARTLVCCSARRLGPGRPSMIPSTLIRQPYTNLQPHTDPYDQLTPGSGADPRPRSDVTTGW